MTATTVTLSSKGQLALPKQLREADDLDASDVFRLERLGPGKYLLEKLTLPRQPKARLVRDKDGLPLFRVPRGSRRLTTELIRKLEAETL